MNDLMFKTIGKDVKVFGYPELEGCTGILDNDGMAFFFAKNEELYIANTTNGKIRKFSSNGYLLVNDCDIDFDAIAKVCTNGFHNAKNKEINYSEINRWDGFMNGICAIHWMLYPDGRYFADSDGFGMEDNDEENVYAIIDTNLNIVEPFRPIKDIETYLEELRKNKCEILTNKQNSSIKTKIFKYFMNGKSSSILSISSLQKKYEKLKFHKRLFTILWMAFLLVFHTSCNDSMAGLENSYAELKSHVAEQKVQNLIQQARHGDIEAYKSLALCYRDGNGVDKSYLNMICMYVNYYKRTGKDVDKVIELLEEGHPFRLFANVLDSSTQNEEFMKRLNELEKDAPAEVKAIKAAYSLYSEEKIEVTLNTLRKSEEEGSELAALFQIVYYEEKNLKDDYEQCLIRLAEKYPFLNLKIGELYVEKYWESKDFSDIQKAMEYYYKADAYAMLTPKYACGLINMYNYYEKQGLLNCNEQEMERLKKITNIGD